MESSSSDTPVGWSAPEPPPRLRGRIGVAVPATVLLVTIGGFFGARSLERRDVRTENGHHAEIAAAEVEGSVRRAAGSVGALRRLVASEPDVTPEDFSNFATSTLESVGLADAAWVERVAAADRRAYERRVGRPITDVAGAASRPAPDRRDYYPASYASRSGEVVRVGADLGAVPAVRAALKAGRPGATATAPVDVGGTRRGLFLVEPAPRLTPDGRKQGFVVAFVPQSRLLGGEDVSVVRVGGGVLGRDGRRVPSAEHSFTAAGQRWTVAIRPIKATGTEAALPWIVLVSGLLLTVLSGLFERHAASRRRVERALGAAEVKYRQLVEHLPVPTYVVDLDTDSVLYASPQYVELLGYPLEEWLGDRHLYEKILHPDDGHVIPRTRLLHSRGEVFSGEYRLIARDGRMVWVHDEARVVRDASGTPLYSQGFLLDVTAEKEAEERQRRLEEELRQAQKMEAVGRLAGGIAHDFNNLLTAITGYSELLLESGDLDDPVRSDVAGIKEAADRAAALTRQLLTFSRRKPLQAQLVDLNRIVGDTVPMLGRLIGEDVELETRLAPDELLVHADPVQLEQVVLNLSVNGRDAMPSGGRLTIATSAAERGDGFGGEFAVLSVADAGEGMDDETRLRIFEPFFTTKETGRGTGLGLSTVYAIVEQAGGHINVSSTPGTGSSFSVFLPREGGPAAAPAVDGRAAGAANGAGGQTILVVEDQARVRALVVRILSRHGYRTVEADSGTEALRLLEDGGADVRLVLTDLVMPGMTGNELGRRLEDRFPALPVVYMSGYPGEERRYGALPPASLLIEKPFTPGALLDRVAQALAAARYPA